jgi:hypothetical protein
MRARIFSVVTLVIAFQSPAFGDVVINAGGRFESLLGLRIGPRGVTFEVRGQGPGCTAKEHFHVERFGQDPAHLILIRDVPSAGTIEGVCRHNRVFRQAFFFSFRELELDLGERIEVVNPVQVNDIPRLAAPVR